MKEVCGRLTVTFTTSANVNHSAFFCRGGARASPLPRQYCVPNRMASPCGITLESSQAVCEYSGRATLPQHSPPARGTLWYGRRAGRRFRILGLFRMGQNTLTSATCKKLRTTLCPFFVCLSVPHRLKLYAQAGSPQLPTPGVRAAAAAADAADAATAASTPGRGGFPDHGFATLQAGQCASPDQGAHNGRTTGTHI